ncbi:MAG: hypothetical protein NTV94_03440 [Planctomycetota bacterium]|nr:hypothetical protein [Planctomycetota bacterium]
MLSFITRRDCTSSLLASAVLAACCVAPVHAQETLFKGMGVLAGDASGSMGIGQCMSADGSTVVGWSSRFSPSVRSLAVRHTSAGVVSLGTLTGTTSSVAFACSADAQTVVGFCTGGATTKAFRYAAGQMVQLGLPPVAGAQNLIPKGVSWDGSVTGGVVSIGTQRQGWRLVGSTYTMINGPAGSTYSDVKAVSGDGMVLVGEVEVGAAPNAFKWSSLDGMIFFSPPAGMTGGTARAVNADGRVVVGSARASSNDRAVVWRSGGATGLMPMTPTDTAWRANSVSATGSIIGGESGGINSGETRACIWTPDGTVYSVTDLLNIRGVFLNNWTLYSVNSVTPDGQYVSGLGQHTLSDGTRRQEIWVAKLPGLCPGDWNGDGTINQADLYLFISDWENTRADFNLDGGCDGADLEAFSNAWSNGRCR